MTASLIPRLPGMAAQFPTPPTGKMPLHCLRSRREEFPKERRKATAPKAEVRRYKDGHFRRTFLGCSGKAAFPKWEKLPSWPIRWLDSPLHLVPVFLSVKRALVFRAALLFNPQHFFLGGLRLRTPLSALGSCLNCC